MSNNQNIEEQMSQAHDILEGEYEPSIQQQKLFKNLSAACDYLNSFNINNYVIQDGHTQDGKYVVQVSYQRAV